MPEKLPTRSELAARLDVELEGWETVTPSQRAYLAALIETAGNQGRAAEAAGIHRSTALKWTTGWRDTPPNPAYLEALELAKEVAANVLEDEARRRAYDGVRRYQFDGGKPKLHPELCECGHELREHDRPREATGEARATKREAIERGEDVDPRVRPCLHCTCADFIGAPYFEHEYSDKLMALLLGAKKPEEYATKRVELTGTIRNLNWDTMPDALVARIAAGENPLSVLASAAEEGHGRLLESGAVLGGPGTEDDGGEREAGAEREDDGGGDAGEDL